MQIHKYNRYNRCIISWCQKCADDPETTDIISWCQKCVIQYRHHFMVSEVLDNPGLLQGNDARISNQISLCHSGFKGPAISSVSRNSDLQ